MRKISLFEDALPAPLFRRLVRAVRKVGTERLAESYNTNFWFAAGAKPGNVVEEVITRLFRVVRPGPRCIGVEWWLGRLPYGKSLPMHFDRDLALERQTGEVVYPLWASILYLNRFPTSPTLVLDQVLADDKKTMVPPKAKYGRALEPVPNHYVVYRGNLYHGVVANGNGDGHKAPGRSRKSRKPPELRLTLLINYWDRRPLPPVCRDYDGTVYSALRKGY
jgi:hypothetical protein